MKYVFETSPLSVLFRTYNQDRFPFLWNLFNELADADLVNDESAVTSIAGVLRELEDAPFSDAVDRWRKAHTSFFPVPARREAKFVRRIFRVSRFRTVIERKKIVSGGKNADPLVIARAKVVECKVVTLGRLTKTRVKIPDIAINLKSIVFHSGNSWKNNLGCSRLCLFLKLMIVLSGSL